MLIVGFIKMDRREVLINPVTCKDEVELYKWLASFFSDEHFSLDAPITQEKISASLLSKVPVLIAIKGYEVAIMFGEVDVIQSSIDRFVHTDQFNYTDFMAN